jgi:hypothetical protein
MRTTKQDAKRPLPRSSTPRTDEAVERWQQGKANLIEEMAKMELDLHEECRLNGMGAERECKLRSELERWRNCARQLAALGMSKDFQTSGEWNKAMDFYRKLQDTDKQ